MALPKLNTDFEFEMTLPVAGTTHKYRPYLVKEEKLLLAAKEAGNVKEAFEAVRQVLDNCVKGVDGAKLSIADMTYAFLQLRGKSVSETAEFSILCEKCEAPNAVAKRIDTVTIDSTEKMSDTVEVTDTISLKMRHPQLGDMIESNSDFSTDKSALTFKMVDMCIEAVATDEELIPWKENSREERDEFIESLNDHQFSQIENYMASIPSLTLDVDFECSACGHHNKRSVEGLQNFFA